MDEGAAMILNKDAAMDTTIGMQQSTMAELISCKVIISRLKWITIIRKKTIG